MKPMFYSSSKKVAELLLEITMSLFFGNGVTIPDLGILILILDHFLIIDKTKGMPDILTYTCYYTLIQYMVLWVA